MSAKKNLQLVKVYVRVRPFTKDELELKRKCIIHEMTSSELVLKSGSTEKKYTFDSVFSNSTTQEEVYKTVVAPLVSFFLSGYTCTVFAYGQTGTGKTYTMTGKDVTPNINFINDPSAGLIPRAAIQMFSELKQLNLEYSVRVSFVEIYNEDVRDLLVSDSVPLRVYDDPDNKSSTCIRGVTERMCANINEVYEVLLKGTAERQTANTYLNRCSSRSHTIFTININTREVKDGEEINKNGKLHLIDLAGSENIGKSGATEMRAREAGSINKSLLTLGKVIKALVLKKQHIPYRESKLTRILQDSLGGTSKTCMIATFSPCTDCFEETISTLDYAYMARSVANCPTVNINRTQSNFLKDSQTELTKLREELAAARTGEGFYIKTETYDDMTLDIRKKNERILCLLKSISELEEHVSQKEQQKAELTRCIEKTNSHVEDVKKKLAVEEKKEQEVVYLINFIQEKIKQLQEQNEVLLDVCDNSAKFGSIYYKKYKKQCDFTIHNANIGRKINMFATNALNKIQKSLEKLFGELREQSDDGRRRVAVIRNTQEKSVEQLKIILKDLRLLSEGFTSTFDDLFSNKGFTHLGFKNQLNSFLNDSHMAHVQEMQSAKSSLENAEKYVAEECTIVEAKTAESKDLIRRKFMKRNENSTTTAKHLENLNVNLRERYVCVQQQLECVERAKANYARQIEDFKLKREYLNKEKDIIRNIQETNEQLRKHTANKLLLDIKNAFTDFTGILESVKNASSVVGSTTKALVEKNKVCEQEIKAFEMKSQKYVSDFLELALQELDDKNHKINDTFLDLSERISEIRETLQNTVAEYVPNPEDQIAARNRQNEDIEQFMQESLKDLKSLESNVEFKIHAGDTPVKPVHSYPKNLENLDELSEKFENLNSPQC